MDFIEKLGDTISSKGKEVVEKVKDTAEIFRLKGQVSTCEEVIRKNYLEIGKLFFEQHGDDPDAPFEKQRTAIQNAQTGVKELREKIDELRGI